LSRQEMSRGDMSREKYVSSIDSTISSWFFSLNEASIGLISMNMRNRLAGYPSSTDAGNYVQMLVLAPEDYVTPKLVREGLEKHRCCSGAELPPFRWGMTSSMYLGWQEHFNHLQLKLEEGSRVRTHLPLLEAAVSDLPDRLSLWATFTAEGAHNGCELFGAFVICRKSVWSKVKDSGIVSSAIFSTWD
jgi:hypothetical protein